MKYLVLIPILILSGCFYQRIDQFDIQRAISYCGSIENVVIIEANFLADESARCINKPSKSLYDVEIVK